MGMKVAPVLLLSLFAMGCGSRQPIPVTATKTTNIGAESADFSVTDWPRWRGVNGDGHAGEQDIVTSWSENENVIWKTDVPGRGHSSPVVVGDRVYLTTAEKGEYIAVLAYDRKSGDEVWRTNLHTEGIDGKLHERNSYATATPAWNGEALFVPCFVGGQVVVSRVNADGKIAWQQSLMKFKSLWGYSVSPVLHDNLVILAVEHLAAGAIVALGQESGEEAWRTPRPETPNHATPVLMKLNERTELVIPGAHQLASFDPATGKEYWSTPATTLECVGSAVQVGNLVFGSGGYPDHKTSCVDASRPDKAVWHAKTKVYQPSLISVDDYVYGVTDQGIAHCWEASSGKEKWKARLANPQAGSPVVVNDLILVVGERGLATFFKASPKKFAMVAQNQLGNDVYASPVICHDRIYLRVGRRAGGKRQETLYCIGR